MGKACRGLCRRWRMIRCSEAVAAAGFGEIATGERDPEEMGPFLLLAVFFFGESQGRRAAKLERRV
jgi:hypothetical protein